MINSPEKKESNYQNILDSHYKMDLDVLFAQVSARGIFKVQNQVKFSKAPGQTEDQNMLCGKFKSFKTQ